MVEWIYNCFTMMDSGGVFFTNGAMDTYAAWYLQRVRGVRPDLIVFSLQFLVGADYREFLSADSQVRAALNLSRDDSLPVPPSTSETQDALEEIIIRSVRKPDHPPLYLAPRCRVADRFRGHIVDLGLVQAYQDSTQPQTRSLDLLISKLTQEWTLRYASQGPPEDSSYAARVAWLQYLTLAIRMALKFQEQKHYQDMDTLFTYLEPVVGEDWRFSLLRYEHCLRSKEECSRYLEKVKEYAADHPDDIEIMYHFNFDKLALIVTLRTYAPKKKCEIESLLPIMEGAEWIEREIHELFGVEFKNHPNMRPLLLPDDWPRDKYPLRKECKLSSTEENLTCRRKDINEP